MATYDVGYVYYINQGTEPFASIKMKSGDSVQSSGCAVCSYAMLICHKEGYTQESDAVQVVKDLIKNCTDADDNLDTKFQNKTIHGITYSAKKVSDMAAQIHEGIPVVARLEKNGKAVHFATVVGTDTSLEGMAVYQVKDPGKRANKTLADTMSNYEGCVLEGKFIIE